MPLETSQLISMILARKWSVNFIFINYSKWNDATWRTRTA